MTRRALLVLVCAAIVPAAHAAPRRKLRMWKPRKPPAPPPGSIEPKAPKVVRTMLYDSNWQQHPSFEQRWAGEGQ